MGCRHHEGRIASHWIPASSVRAFNRADPTRKQTWNLLPSCYHSATGRPRTHANWLDCNEKKAAKITHLRPPLSFEFVRELALNFMFLINGLWPFVLGLTVGFLCIIFVGFLHW